MNGRNGRQNSPGEDILPQIAFFLHLLDGYIRFLDMHHSSKRQHGNLKKRKGEAGLALP
jgi:hypothetical protein